MKSKLLPTKIFKCGCELYSQDNRAWTIYCAEHGKDSYPSDTNKVRARSEEKRETIEKYGTKEDI